MYILFSSHKNDEFSGVKYLPFHLSHMDLTQSDIKIALCLPLNKRDKYIYKNFKMALYFENICLNCFLFMMNDLLNLKYILYHVSYRQITSNDINFFCLLLNERHKYATYIFKMAVYLENKCLNCFFFRMNGFLDLKYIL